jgi:hypothetical protein
LLPEIAVQRRQNEFEKIVEGSSFHEDELSTTHLRVPPPHNGLSAGTKDFAKIEGDNLVGPIGGRPLRRLELIRAAASSAAFFRAASVGV